MSASEGLNGIFERCVMPRCIYFLRLCTEKLDDDDDDRSGFYFMFTERTF